MKPAIRIRLVKAKDDTAFGGSEDFWDAQLSIVDSEGKTITKHHPSCVKSDALFGAYRSLEKHTIRRWYHAFYCEEHAKYEELLNDHEIFEVWIKSMDKVQTGDITKEQHLERWAMRLKLVEKATSRSEPTYTLPTIAEDTPFRKRQSIANDLLQRGKITQYQFDRWSRKHFEGECPFPKKWKWYHWFWNPQD